VTNKRAAKEPFVEFGPTQARKARDAANLPEPSTVTDVSHGAGFFRRLWAYLTQGSDDLRKLWGWARTW
jgi:hypothetical protein